MRHSSSNGGITSSEVRLGSLYAASSFLSDALVILSGAAAKDLSRRTISLVILSGAAAKDLSRRTISLVILSGAAAKDLQPHGQSRISHAFLEVDDFDFAKMKYGCGQHRIGFAQGDGLDAVFDGAGATAGNEGKRHVR